MTDSAGVWHMHNLTVVHQWLVRRGYDATGRDLHRLKRLARAGTLLLGLTARFEEWGAMVASRLGWARVCQAASEQRVPPSTSGAATRSRPMARSSGSGCAYELQDEQHKRAFRRSGVRKVLARLPTEQVPSHIRARFDHHNGLDQQLYGFAVAESASWRFREGGDGGTARPGASRLALY